jgi:hypothetical protein
LDYAIYIRCVYSSQLLLTVFSAFAFIAFLAPSTITISMLSTNFLPIALCYTTPARGATYKVTVTLHGLNDECGSPNCSATTEAREFHLDVKVSLPDINPSHIRGAYQVETSPASPPQSRTISSAPAMEQSPAARNV